MLEAPIVEVFRSWEGEGEFIGTPTIFIRLAGCTVGCKECDSKQTWDTFDFPKQTIHKVVDMVNELRKPFFIPRISITGGEPLLNETFVLELCWSLMTWDNRTILNLETSGTLFPDSIFSNKDKLTDSFDTISMDIKTPSSGVVLSDFQVEKIKGFCIEPSVYIKAVIGSPEDINFVFSTFEGLKVNSLMLTPCEVKGEFYPLDKIYSQLEIIQPEIKFKVVCQQHKLLGYR
jgi:7-carboxy-7-deazaguanine synthase